MSTLQIIEITDERQEAQTDILKTQYAEKNILLSVRRSCFVAPGLEAWERLFPGHREPGPGHSETSASSVEDGSWSSPSEDTQDHNIHLSIKLSKKYKMNTWCQCDFVPTISRFSLTRLLSLSSSFWILWVKSSFLLLRSLFLSSRGLHCFSDSRTRFSWLGQIDTGMYRSATNTRQIYSERGKSYQFIPLIDQQRVSVF